jgi:hypothetical protein
LILAGLPVSEQQIIRGLIIILAVALAKEEVGIFYTMSTNTFARAEGESARLTTMRAGIIGLGFIGEVHARAIRANGHIIRSVSAANLRPLKVVQLRLVHTCGHYRRYDE